MICRQLIWSVVAASSIFLTPIAALATESFDSVRVSEQFYGIGARLEMGADGRSIVINSILYGSPAQIDGTIKAGDVLDAVKQAESDEWTLLHGFPLNLVVSEIRGQLDVPVWLRLNRGADLIEVALVRKPLSDQ